MYLHILIYYIYVYSFVEYIVISNTKYNVFVGTHSVRRSVRAMYHYARAHFIIIVLHFLYLTV